MGEPKAAAAAVSSFDDPSLPLASCTLLAQGAEARVFEGIFLGKTTILKQRFSKKYRHPALDLKLTVTRLKQEVRSMVKARKLGLAVPAVYYVEHEASTIFMEKVVGRSVKEILLAGNLAPEDLERILRDIGRAIAVLHDGSMVHGDLTTSNMIVRDADNALVLIDFGLSSTSTFAEDKGVDLYVLERAFTSAHSTMGPLFDRVLESYRKNSKQWSATWNRFAEVRQRGRKRAMVG